MDAVKEFNGELCSLYDLHPPITKAKMNQITKSAIRALKFYKHVVQSVEKFIQKCRQEYKVPGLYIIDSIIRYSRKQFGADKDMFAPRFSKNIVITFHNLFECPTEDISKMIRVLNLWQKNGVYHPGIIQPLLDLASDPHNPAVFETVQKQVEQVTGLAPSMLLKCDQKPPALTADALQLGAGIDLKSDVQGDFSKVLNQLVQSMIPPNPAPPPLGLNPQMQLQLFQQLFQLPVPMVAPTQLVQNNVRLPSSSSSSTVDNNLIGQIQMLTQQLLSQTPTPSMLPCTSGLETIQKQPEPNSRETESYEYGEGEEPREMSSLDKRIMFMCQDEDCRDEADTSYNSSKKSSQSRRMSHTDEEANRNVSEAACASDADVPSVASTTPDRGSSQRSSPRKASNYGDPCGNNDEDDLPNRVTPSETNAPDEDDDLRNGSGDEESRSSEDDTRESVSGRRSNGSKKSRRRHGSSGESRGRKRSKWHDHSREEGTDGHKSRKSKHNCRSTERSSKHKKSDKCYSPDVYDEPTEKSRHKKRHKEKQDSKSSPEREQVESRRSKDGSRRLEVHDRSSREIGVRSREDEKHKLSSRAAGSPSRKKRRAGYTVEYGTNEDEGDDDDDDVIFVDMQKKSVDVSRFLEKKLPVPKLKRKRISRSSSRGSSVEFISHDVNANKDREYMPSVKHDMMSVCSTTLWIGHLNKLTSEEELRAELTEFSDMTVNLVPPRGCAFICFPSRKQAFHALNQLKNVVIQGSQLKVAWAAGVGIKNSPYYEKYDIDVGVTYIPWSELPSLDLLPLLEGSFVDDESLPANFDRENLVTKKSKKKKMMQQEGGATGDATSINPSLIPLPQPMPPLPSLPPPPLPPINTAKMSTGTANANLMQPPIIPPLPPSAPTSICSGIVPSATVGGLLPTPSEMLKTFPAFDPSIPPPSIQALMPLAPKDNNIRPGPLRFLTPTNISSTGMALGRMESRHLAASEPQADKSSMGNADVISRIPVLVNSQTDAKEVASKSFMNAGPPSTPNSYDSLLHNAPAPAMPATSTPNLLQIPALSQVVMLDKPLQAQIGLLPQGTNFVVQRQLETPLNMPGCIMRPLGLQMNSLDQTMVKVDQIAASQVITDALIKDATVGQESNGNQMLIGQGVRPSEVIIQSNMILPSLGVLPMPQMRPNLLQLPPNAGLATTINHQDTIKRLPMPSEFLRRLGASAPAPSQASVTTGNINNKPLLPMPPINVPPPSYRIPPSSSMTNALATDASSTADSASSSLLAKQPPEPLTSSIQNFQQPNVVESDKIPDLAVPPSMESKPHKQPLLETPVMPQDNSFHPHLAHPTQLLNMNHPAYNNLDLHKKGPGTLGLQPPCLIADRFRTPRPPKLSHLGENFETQNKQNAPVILNFQGAPASNPTEALISEAIKSLSPLVRIPAGQECMGFLRAPLVNPSMFLGGPRIGGPIFPDMSRIHMRGPRGVGFKPDDRRNVLRPAGFRQRSSPRHRYSSPHENNMQQ